MDSHILRFEARLVSKIPEYCSRIFIVSYFLSDDTIKVSEIARANSGIKNIDFLNILLSKFRLRLQNFVLFLQKAGQIARSKSIHKRTAFEVYSPTYVCGSYFNYKWLSVCLDQCR